VDRWDLLHALELFIKREYMVLRVACSIDSTFAYCFARSFLKEICFALEGNTSIHPWEGVGNIVDSRLFQFAKETIGTESNVLAYEGCIHTHEVEWKRLANEVLLVKNY
jgi:hypothetical protein